jgi:glyoxylase-like metal-dependent hydrolase (beta-lactamase superfamily II)
VWCLPGRIVNIYFVGDRDGAWTLIDTGMPTDTRKIRMAAIDLFGDHPAEAIVLTHAHIDHTGAARALATAWDIRIYAHRLEIPFASGAAKYPPFDPTVGGLFPFLSRFFPEHGADLDGLVNELPVDGSVPTMPGWRWYHTPGHAPGHIALFRAEDRTLIAGDAFVTQDMKTMRGLLTQKPRFMPPPEYATYDWDQSRASIQLLAGLQPRVVGTGHGKPLSGDTLAEDLLDFAAGFQPPLHGRYVPEPARVDADGSFTAPPPAPDPVPRIALGVGATAVAGLAVSMMLKQSRRPK